MEKKKYVFSFLIYVYICMFIFINPIYCCNRIVNKPLQSTNIPIVQNDTYYKISLNTKQNNTINQEKCISEQVVQNTNTPILNPLELMSAKHSNNKIHLTDSEKQLLEKLVEAEAGNQSYEGKLAVTTVVINRLQSDKFPNNIHDVIYQKNQFTPAQNGSINNTNISNSTKEAIHEVINNGYRSFNKEVFYFCNPKLSTSKWMIKNKTLIKSIGNHNFYK